MDNNGERGQKQVMQFREISEIDKRLVGRLTVDRTKRTPTGNHNVDMTPLAQVFRRTSRETADIRNIFQTLPDLHLPREILISAIVSPGDLSQTSLIFGNDLKGVDTSLIAPMNQVLENFFLTEQKLETKVPEWIDDALIWSGAHPIMIIPEASLDRIITGGVNSASMESVANYGGEFEHGWYKPKGILGLRLPTANAESYISCESVAGRFDQRQMLEYHTIKGARGEKKVTLPFMVTDNMAVFRKPAVQEIKRSRAMETAFGVPALESRKRQRLVDNAEKEGRKLSNSEVYTRFFNKPQQAKRTRLEVIPTARQAGGDNIGHPLVYHLPTEAVMPVCVPGDESNHIGYMVLLDNNGFPVSYTRRLNFYDDIRAQATGNGSSATAAGELLNMANIAVNGNVNNFSKDQIDRLVDLHSEMIDADLVARLKSGLIGGDFEITKSEHVNRLMLTRTFKNQLTTILYVPAELMVYMAFDYNEYGIGKSILEDAKALAAMRASVTVANVIGSTKNAIPGKDINIELDPDDGNPAETATYMAQEALGLAYHHFPMAINSTVGLAEQLQMSAFSVNVTGNPRYPDVKTTITPRESQQVVIDTEFMQTLRDDLTRVFGLTPEATSGINQPEFAYTAVQNNLMLLKRVMVIQGKANPQITDYVRIFSYNSGPLVDDLLEVITQNANLLPKEFKDQPEEFLEEYLNTLTVKLPEPETDNLSKQLEMFKNFSTALDDVLPVYIKEEYFDGYSPDMVREALPTVVEAWRGVILRQWMRKRGILRELDIFSTAEDGSPLMDLSEEMSSHVDSVMKSIDSYVKKVAYDAAKRKVRLAKTDEEVAKAKEALDAIGQPPEPEQPVDDGTGDPEVDAAADTTDTGTDIDAQTDEVPEDSTADNAEQEDETQPDDDKQDEQEEEEEEPETQPQEEPEAKSDDAEEEEEEVNKEDDGAANDFKLPPFPG